MILPAITTITKSAWRDKVEEVRKFGLKEIALFPTCLSLEERKELYDLLKGAKIKRIPFVHLRSDMELWELDYLAERYGTLVFNIHPQREYPILHDLGKYKKSVYVENVYGPLDEKEIREFAGICLDLSHLENARLQDPKKYQHNLKLIEKYPPGCSHVSAIKPALYIDKDDNKSKYDSHFFEDPSELDYLKRYPANYFSNFTAVELENSIEEQLKVKDYLLKYIYGK